MLSLMKVADKAVSRVFPFLHQLEGPIPVFTIGIEAGHLHFELVFVHGVIDRNSGIAPDHLLDFGEQWERFPLFQADKEQLVFGDQLVQLLVKL